MFIYVCVGRDVFYKNMLKNAWEVERKRKKNVRTGKGKKKNAGKIFQ